MGYQTVNFETTLLRQRYQRLGKELNLPLPSLATKTDYDWFLKRAFNQNSTARNLASSSYFSSRTLVLRCSLHTLNENLTKGSCMCLTTHCLKQFITQSKTQRTIRSTPQNRKLQVARSISQQS